MARNQEKAQTILARFVKHQENKHKKPKRRRPNLADKCQTLGAAEKWRRQVVKEIMRDVTIIQNAALGEHKIRDLNDNINKLFREKKHWERRIKELNGTDYSKQKLNLGDEPIHSGEYRYFGAAKDLEGVREQLELRKAEKDQRQTRYDLFQRIDYDYFGFGDDDDGILIEKERISQEKAIKHKVELWKQERLAKGLDTYIMPMEDEERGEVQASFVALPSAEEIEALLVEKKKEMLMARYTTDTPEARLLAAHDRMTKHTGENHEVEI